MENDFTYTQLVGDESFIVQARDVHLNVIGRVEGKPSDGGCYLDSLVVWKKYQRMGIAINLMKQAEGTASRLGYSNVWLVVTLANKRAIKLYEKLGYRTCSHPNNLRSCIMYYKLLVRKK